jgi:uncharacterized iron-regulated membrane protein
VAEHLTDPVLCRLDRRALLILLAVTGLVILYTEPINARVHDDVIDIDPTLAESTPSTWGSSGPPSGASTPTGTQYGLVTRIVMTGACLLVLWNVATALVMWNKRRRKGTLGLPRRPVDVRIQRTLGITAVVLAVIYPIWGLSLFLALLVDRFVVRWVPRLRSPSACASAACRPGTRQGAGPPRWWWPDPSSLAAFLRRRPAGRRISRA